MVWVKWSVIRQRLVHTLSVKNSELELKADLNLKRRRPHLTQCALMHQKQDGSFWTTQQCWNRNSPPDCGWTRCLEQGSQRWGNCSQPNPGWRLRKGPPLDLGCSYLKIQLCGMGWSLEAKQCCLTFVLNRYLRNGSFRAQIKWKKRKNCSLTANRAPTGSVKTETLIKM